MATSGRESKASPETGPDAAGLAITRTEALDPGEAVGPPGSAGSKSRRRDARAQAKRGPRINLTLADPARVRVARKSPRPGPPAEQSPAPTDDEPDSGRPACGTRQRHALQSALVAKTVPTDRLHSSWLRPRAPHDERAIRTLAASVRTVGWQHPILVRPHPVIARAYEIVVGELPYQAARFAGLEHVTVVVCRLSDIRALECVLLEDVQRPDLTPFEVAVGYGQLIRTFKYSLADLAKLVGKSARQVAHTLLLLDSPEAAREARERREVKPDFVRPSAVDPDAAGKDVGAPAGGVGAPERLSLNKNMAALERHLSGALGLEVEMLAEGRQGAVQISFANAQQLEWIVLHLSSLGAHSEPEPTCPGLAA